MVDTHAYFGQPGVFPQFQPQTLVPQSLFGAAPGQYAQSLGQLMAGCLAQQQLAGQLSAATGLPGRVPPFDSGLQMLGPTAFAPYAAFTAFPGQYAPPIGQTFGGWQSYSQPGAFPTQTLLGSPQLGGYPGLAGTLPSQFGLPSGAFPLWGGSLSETFLSGRHRSRVSSLGRWDVASSQHRPWPTRPKREGRTSSVRDRVDGFLSPSTLASEMCIVFTPSLDG